MLSGITTAEIESYRPRGWRPLGPSFDPARSGQSQVYGSPALPQSYGVPVHQVPTYAHATMTTTTEEPFTTTAQSREPTTPNSDQDFETNPALAIANSFAFNRPVYVYNTYPFYPGLTFAR